MPPLLPLEDNLQRFAMSLTYTITTRCLLKNLRERMNARAVH